MPKAISFFCFFLPTVIFAQSNHLVDSLVAVFETTTVEESTLPLLRQICAEHPSSKGRMIYAREMLKLAETFESAEYVHYAYMELGIAYRLQGNLTESTRHLFISLEKAKELKDQKKIGESYGEIAATFASQGDIGNAVKYINQAIELFRAEQDSVNLCIALLNTGYDYHTMGKMDSALLYYAEAESIARHADFDPHLRSSLSAYIRGNRGITQAEIGLEQEAIASIDSAIAVLQTLDDRQAIVDYDYRLANIYYKIGELDKAMLIARETLLEATILNIKATMRDASLLLYRMHLSQQDYKNALKYRLTHEAIKDSIQNSNVIREMANQKAAYDIGLMQAELDLLDAQKKNQMLVSTALTAVLLIVLVAGVLFYKNYRQKILLSEKLENKRVLLERINTTKDKLFSIISHDLRGPITAFSGLARIVKFYVITNKTDELLELSDQMQDSAKKLNAMLENLLAWTIQEQGQLELKMEVISIEKIIADLTDMYKAMLEEKNITIKIEPQEDVQIRGDWNTLHTAIRNLISNAIKFTNEGGSVMISWARQGQKCILTVSDNGIGISEEKIATLFRLDNSNAQTFGTRGEKGLGLGLKLVHEFIELNRGTISVESAVNKGTTFSIQLPIATIPETAEVGSVNQA